MALWALIATKVYNEKDKSADKPSLQLQHLADQDLQDFICWQNQVKSSFERHVQTANLAAHEEQTAVVKKYIPPDNCEKPKDIVEDNIDTSHKSSPFVIKTDEMTWLVRGEEHQDL